MTAPPFTGRFFVGHHMSEEATPLVVPVAAPSERSEGQPQETTAKVTSPDDPPEAEAPEPEDQPEPDAEANSETDEDDDKGEEDGKPRKRSRSDRLRRQLERLQAENAALKSGSAPAAVQDQAGIDALVAQKIGQPPVEANYADWFAYERAMTAYEAAKLTVSVQIKDQVSQQQGAEQQRLADRLDDFSERCDEVAKAIPDFMKVVQSPTYVTTDLTKRLILDAGEKAPLVSYYLAQNPKLTAQINAMPPLQAAREMGRIEARVSMPKPKSATSASAPMSSPKGTAAPQSTSRDLDAWLSKTYGKRG
jgi:hypothetical protein